jgi:hypothetical protein
MKKNTERYSLEQSPFYKMGRARDLAALLHLSPKQLKSIIVRRSALYNFREETIGEKKRNIAVPIREMRPLHERIKALLSRIILPNYIFSPRKGRASNDNALVHQGSAVIAKLDVKQFYPSTTSEHVFQFFRHRLGMVDDVAGRLTQLCTINGRVPFGSPLSPILCALVHDDIFSKVAKKCELKNDTMTLWVDDITVSGAHIDHALLRDIRRLIAAKGLRSHKSQRSNQRKGIVITGTFVSSNGPAPANKSHKKMSERLKELNDATLPTVRAKLADSAIGMVNHQLTIYPKDSPAYVRLLRRRQWLWNDRRKSEAAIDEAAKLPQHKAGILDDGTIPW